jgi:DNA-binding NarL/FixJ family response regulator
MAPLKTYLVEDSRIIRDNLIATLEELLPVTVVGSAEDESTAVQWLEHPEHEADLVIVDIFLKRGSGLGVLPRRTCAASVASWAPPKSSTSPTKSTR